MDPPQIKVSYVGADVTGTVVGEQISTIVWAVLRKQRYVDGSEARVVVEKRPSTVYVEASAREPNGPILRLLDLELPAEGVTEAKLADYLAANGLTADTPLDAVMVGINRPTVISRKWVPSSAKRNKRRPS